MIVRAALSAGILGLAAVAALAPVPASWVETWYSRGVYPVLQTTLTPFSNRFPVALLDVTAAVLLACVVWRFWRRIRRAGLIRATGGALAGALVLGATGYLTFLLLWGLNYRRVPLVETLDIDDARVTADAVRLLARTAVAEVNELHPRAHADGGGGIDTRSFAQALQRIGAQGRTAPATPKASALQLYFRYAAIDGMTNPFFHEIILNPDLAAFERPFVLAHEWAHLAGYASEDEANLIAWLACLEGTPLGRYSGWLVIYEHAVTSLPRPERRPLSEGLAEGPRRDLRTIAERYARAQPVVRMVARDTYDTYLKANRVADGIASYDRVVRLVVGAGPEHGWAPRTRAR